jgi:uncharacterized protein (TIGR03435 family)
MRPALAAALAFFAVYQTAAQSPRTFEVASVRPSQPGKPAGASLDPAHFQCSGETLLGLIISAYRLPAWRLSGGPDWLSSDAWDISATLPSSMPTDRAELMHETDLMLQALFADRFKLTMHRETREQPSYALVVAKGGSKLRLSTSATFSVKTGKGHLELHHVSMSGFVTWLHTPQAYGPQPADRPVIDMTGLTGFFDLTLDWMPDSAQPDTAATGPSLFTALEEQAGLKLQARKSSFEFLVIDHVEKPAENQ